MKSFSLSHALVNLSRSVNLKEFKSRINVENFNSSILLSSIFKNIDKNILVTPITLKNYLEENDQFIIDIISLNRRSSISLSVSLSFL